MLHQFIGPEYFKMGIREYIQAFSYGNADTDDLWKFMSKSSGIDVGSLMNSWIRKMGFPVVVVTVLNTPDIDISGKVTLKLTQHRFCGGNTQSPQKQPMLWSIPIQGDK